MMFHVPLRRARRTGLLIAALIVHRPSSAVAQSSAGKVAVGSRAELLARSRAADSTGRMEEAFVLRARLRDGDFEVGDAVIATFEGMALKKRDSLVVQAGKILRLEEPIGDVSLVGVLRSEIEDSVRARVAVYYSNTVVHVTPLVRVSISGAVRLPGTYQWRPDTPLSDVIMRAGQDQTADMRNVTIKRGERTLWTSPDVQSALSEGLTLDRLSLDPGDEIVVGAKNVNHWTTIMAYSFPIISSIVILVLRR